MLGLMKACLWVWQLTVQGLKLESFLLFLFTTHFFFLGGGGGGGQGA